MAKDNDELLRELEQLKLINEELDSQKEIEKELKKIHKEINLGLRDQLSSYEENVIKAEKSLEIEIKKLDNLEQQLIKAK